MKYLVLLMLRHTAIYKKALTFTLSKNKMFSYIYFQSKVKTKKNSSFFLTPRLCLTHYQYDIATYTTMC